ncbi:MAG: protein-L-isoaspartate(D-aspartate) O-methyltransferase [Bacteroidetes bacterium]|nr:protein-L-isoaspartate(D-aspartate) O-methyltransferase [Bacteroidota bacterium]
MKLFLLTLLAGWLPRVAITQDFQAQREKMVLKQIAQRGISNKRVLTAMKKVERHRFVPLDITDHAYDDVAQAIGEGQTISQPYVVAFMTDALNIQPDDKVLEIGTGSGYQAAVLAELGKEVYTIEINTVLSARAEAVLKSLHYKNIYQRTGDGYLGWPEAAPFDAITVTCSPSKIPQPLIDQLKDGGRMIIPVDEGDQFLILLTKKKGKLIKEKILPVIFVPMHDNKGKKY